MPEKDLEDRREGVFGESGPAKELLHKYELDAEGIAKRIMEEQKSC